MAIGANTADILRLVFSQGAKLILAGLGIGLVLALILDRFLASYLLSIGASDPATMVASSILLVAIAVGAIWVPARRASRVDPIVVLRVD
jgi:putative ABC transport system permease protein